MESQKFVAQAPQMKGIVQKRVEGTDGKPKFVKIGEVSLWEKDPEVNHGYDIGGNLQLNGERLYVWIQTNGHEEEQTPHE